MFQFPSNGKAYPKQKEDRPFDPKTLNKFQFPSNGKAYPKIVVVILRLLEMRTSFNSLQTGKRIQRLCAIGVATIAAVSFNSLQTGKRIQRQRRRRYCC